MPRKTGTSPKAPSSKQDYGAAQIQVLKGLEAVRKRPGMYIGSTSARGLHHCVWEIIDNSIDEVLAGHATRVDVTVHKDGSISVQDNGRGIPTDIHPTEKKSGVEVALTVLHAGGKFDGSSYKVSGGLHGVGAAVVNFLSEWFEVTVEQHGQRHSMAFDRGVPRAALKAHAKSKRTGTLVRFKPDAQIFTETTTFALETLVARIRQYAMLNSEATLTLTDERTGFSETFSYKGGISEMVAHTNRTKDPIHRDILHFQGEAEGVFIDIALQYTDRYDENLYSFANNIRTPDGGTHETGFRAALTQVVNAWISANAKQKDKKLDVQGKDLREGLTAVVAVRLPNPQFEGQTKAKLGNSEIRGLVQTFFSEQLAAYLAKHPKTVKAIAQKAITAAKGRVSAKRAKDLVRRKTVLESGVLPGKLADCSNRDPSGSEIFIVEGDSAGGSCKMGRDRRFQAVIPLKGKILNVERAQPHRVLENNEIKAIITALGTGGLG